MTETVWSNLRSKVARPSALALLVPHGGAGPTSMWDMAERLPPDWGVHALCLPGRERRIAEPPEWAPEGVARDAADALTPLVAATSGPVVLAGQCLGGWLAYLILREADAALAQRCRSLVVLSQKPWDAPRLGRSLPDDPAHMWAALEATGDTPAEIAVDDEFRELLEPIIRADHEAIRHFPTAQLPVTRPITVVVGEHDPALERLRPQDWARYTPELTTVRLPCGHLPAQDLPGEVATLLTGIARQ